MCPLFDQSNPVLKQVGLAHSAFELERRVMDPGWCPWVTHFLQLKPATLLNFASSFAWSGRPFVEQTMLLACLVQQSY